MTREGESGFPSHLMQIQGALDLMSTADSKLSERDLTRWAKRSRKVRRVRARERAALGLQAGVGADDYELERARFYRSLEQVIARELREAELSPLARVGFDGRPLTVEATVHPERYTAHPDRDLQPWVKRNTSASPLDYLFFQSKGGLEFWEWIAGKRFELDYAMAHTGAAVTVSLERLLLAKRVKGERKAPRARSEPAPPPQTFRPKAAARPYKAPSTGLTDSRIDALARMGRLAAEISKVSFYFLEEVIGRERWLKDVALTLGCAPEYVSTRFREALTEAADHYQVRATPRTRGGRMAAWREGTFSVDETQWRRGRKGGTT